MFCSKCGSVIKQNDKYCQKCGAELQQQTSPFQQNVPTETSPLLTLTHLVMIRDNLAFRITYKFQDSYGVSLGEVKGEMQFPLKFTLHDTSGQSLLWVEGSEKGLMLIYLIHDASENTLASLKQKSSFMSRKYGIIVNSIESMLLTTDASGAHCKIEDSSSGNVLASFERHSGVKTTTHDINISELGDTDHRILLGSLILLAYLSR